MRVAALRQGLERLGWVEGRSVRIEPRFAGGDPDRVRALAGELASLAPDVIVAGGADAAKAVQQETRTIPIVITQVGDPVANGIVTSLARPEGNTTGVTNLYATIGGKWLQLLKEIAPKVERAGLIYNARLVPDDSGYAYFPPMEEAGAASGVRALRIGYRDAVDLVHAIEEFGGQPNGGLIVMPPAPASTYRETILRLASQYRLPTIFQAKQFVAEGGLLAYGSDPLDQYRRAAAFVDRILRGAKVADLPVEYPTKFELVINLKTAKAIGLDVPPSLLARADEVIE
jgi:putative ABC transport system substrate-binding protein